jgi:hypothetical protein
LWRCPLLATEIADEEPHAAEDMDVQDEEEEHLHKFQDHFEIVGGIQIVDESTQSQDSY